MSQMLVIARKEMKQVIGNRMTLSLGLVVALTFVAVQITAITRAEVLTVAILSNRVFNFSIFLGLFLGYVFAGQIFLREKQEGIIETLLCAPVNLRSILLGKVLGVAIPAYLLSLFSIALLIIVTNIISSSFLWPSSPVIFHVFVGVPVFTTVCVGLMGFFSYLLVRTQALMASIFAAVGLFLLVGEFTRYIIGENDITSWTGVGVFLAICLILLALTVYLVRFLSKEKIVTTIP